MPLAIFRADAGMDLGAGHVMRCLTLAGALAARGWRCAFAVNREALDAVPSLTAASYERCLVSGASTRELGSLAERFPGADLVVIDHYSIDGAYESACRSWVPRIMVIDDLANRRHDADLLLDQTLGRGKDAYAPLVPTGCRLMLGSGYALLRPEFAERRDATLHGRSARKTVSRAFVSLGATDPQNLTALALDAIASSGVALSADAVVGAANPHRVILADRMRVEDTLQVDPPAARIADLMSGADVAIGGGGISAYERCCLGLPSILVVMAENQRPNAKALEETGAAIPVELSANGIDAIREALAGLARAPDRLRNMSAAAARVCDGLGAERAAEAITRAIK